MPRTVPNHVYSYLKKAKDVKIKGEKPTILPDPSTPYYYQRLYLKAFGSLIDRHEERDVKNRAFTFPFFDTIGDATYRKVTDLMIEELFELDVCANEISVKSAQAVATMMELSLNGLMEEHKLDGGITPEDAELTYNEGRLYGDIRQKVNPKKLIKSVDKLVSKIASSLKPKQIEDYFNTQRDKFLPDGKVTEEGLKSFAKVIRDVTKLREKRPWYQRWFQSTCKEELRLAAETLVDRGMNRKQLQAFIKSSDDDAEAKLTALWKASKSSVEKIYDLNSKKAIQNVDSLGGPENREENVRLENDLKSQITSQEKSPEWQDEMESEDLVKDSTIEM